MRIDIYIENMLQELKYLNLKLNKISNEKNLDNESSNLTNNYNN